MMRWLLFALAVAAGDSFLVMTLPTLRQIAYVALPDPVLRQLVVSGLVNPRGVALDSGLFRLYVTDSAQQKVFWYQLSIQGGRLITDGTQHIALESVETDNIAVDGGGNLYFTGKQLVLPPLSPTSGVWRNSALNCHTGTTNAPGVVWTAANTANKWSSSAAVATDNLAVFWGPAQNGEATGTVVKAPTDPPDMKPEGAVMTLAHNEDAVKGIVLTPNFLFYTTPDGVYGITKSKSDAGCEDENTCRLISSETKSPVGIAWDGDGTVYVADSEQNKVFSFPSGALLSHHLTTVCETELGGAKHGVHGLAIVQVAEKPAAAAARGALLVAFALFLAE